MAGAPCGMSLWGQAIPVHRGWMFTQLYISQGTGKTCEQSLQATTTTKSETLQVQRRHTHKNVEEEKVSKESSTWWYVFLKFSTYEILLWNCGPVPYEEVLMTNHRATCWCMYEKIVLCTIISFSSGLIFLISNHYLSEIFDTS